MIAPSRPQHPDIASGLVTFTVAQDGEPCNAVAALARLLIDIGERRIARGEISLLSANDAATERVEE